MFLLAIVHDGFARGKDAFGIRIAVGVGQIQNHVLDDFFGRVQIKHGGIADVELEDFIARFLQLLSRFQHGTANLVAHAVQTRRFVERSHLCPHKIKR